MSISRAKVLSNIYAFFVFYAAKVSFLPTFRDNLPVPIFEGSSITFSENHSPPTPHIWVFPAFFLDCLAVEMGPIGCPPTSVTTIQRCVKSQNSTYILQMCCLPKQLYLSDLCDFDRLVRRTGRTVKCLEWRGLSITYWKRVICGLRRVVGDIPFWVVCMYTAVIAVCSPLCQGCCLLQRQRDQ